MSDPRQATSSGGRRLEGKIAVVTAAAGGIGGASARRLAEDGAAAVIAIDVSPIEEIEEQLRRTGTEALGIRLDCTDEAAVVRVFAEITARFGQIDILVNGLALEMAPFGVNVNAVSPGPIRTPGTDKLPPDVLKRSVDAVPLGYIGEPFDIAHAVAFLVSDEARYITGQNLAVNGGRVFN